MKFKPKNREELRTEVVTNYNLNEEDDKDLINKIVEDRFKDEEFKASEKNKTQKARDEAINLAKAKEFYKKGGSKEKPKNENKNLLSAEDKAYLFGRVGLSRTEVRYLEKTMKATDKPFDKALGDGMFVAWKKENDNVMKRRNSQLGASRGGGKKEDNDQQKKFVDKFSQNLPRGFSAKKSK